MVRLLPYPRIIDFLAQLKDFLQCKGRGHSGRAPAFIYKNVDGRPKGRLSFKSSDIEAEEDHVAVLDHIFLAFDAQTAGLLDLLFAA